MIFRNIRLVNRAGRKLATVLFSLLGLGACGMPEGIVVPRNEAYLKFNGTTDATRYLPAPKRSVFTICHGHTCRYPAVVQLDEVDWQPVNELFSQRSESAIEERSQIGRAIGLMEDIVGGRTGTANDRGRNLSGLGLAGQMDCIDEATNTMTYLILFEAAGYLKWHRAGKRVNRGLFTLTAAWPHSAAGLIERGGSLYVVDSWFRDNGAPAVVVSYRDWRAGYSPEK